MEHIEKTVFLSYRRNNTPWALAIFQNLTHHGYDVFFDFNGITSGDFERVILGNIHARAHFLVLLAPSALERCGKPEDWFRREIESAMEFRRNIVPLMLESFDFGSPGITSQLTGKLATLQHYNALRVHADYFEEAMDRLRDRYLNVVLDTVVHPVSRAAVRAARVEQAAASAAPAVTERELTAQEWFERGFKTNDHRDEELFFSEAIRLQPDYALAFYNRGIVRQAKDDLEGAIEDYSEAIRLRPDIVEAFKNRGCARYHKGDLEGAIEDYNVAIRLKPDYASAFNSRGTGHFAKRDLEAALRDYSEAISIKPDYALAYYNRAEIWQKMNRWIDAIADYQKYLDVGGGESGGDTEEVEEMIRNLKKKSCGPATGLYSYPRSAGSEYLIVEGGFRDARNASLHGENPS